MHHVSCVYAMRHGTFVDDLKSPIDFDIHCAPVDDTTIGHLAPHLFADRAEQTLVRRERVVDVRHFEFVEFVENEQQKFVRCRC